MSNRGRSFESLLMEVLSENTRPIPKPMGGAAETARLLKENHASYREHHIFAEGDLVVWKPGMKNRSTPEYGEPAIVHEIINEVGTKNESGSPYFREPLTLMCGVRKVDDDGENYVVFHFDGNRMMPYTEK